MRKNKLDKRLLKLITADNLDQLIQRINAFVDAKNVVILNYNIEPRDHGNSYQAVLFYQLNESGE